MSLFLVQDDVVWVEVKRNGRFSMDREAAASKPHLFAAVKVMQERMIAGLAKKGYQYVDKGERGFEVTGPEPHYIISDNVDADPGPMEQPDPRDTDKFDAWERAEKARVARKLGERPDLVDFILTATFKRRARPTFHFR